jgi:hypothetical protein
LRAFGCIVQVVPLEFRLVSNEFGVDKYCGRKFDAARTAAGDGSR